MVENEQAVALIPVREKVELAMAELDDFEFLVKSHQQRIYRVLLGMLRDPDAAQNLTQECFLKAYRSRASFRGEANVGAWLLKIAINLARDHRRSRLREFWHRWSSPVEEAEDLGERLPDPHPSPEDALLGREAAEAVWQVVDKLSPQQRAVFVLRFVEELSLEEIAAATGVKMGTVKAHLFRAVHAVRRQIKGGKSGE